MGSRIAKNRNYPIIPDEERKCLWMTTGLISYKLCDRNYECEICPFDQAIKSEESGKRDFLEEEDDWAEGSLKSDPSAWINGSVFYHPDHCWVKVENPEKVRIGIDYLLTRLITHIRVVILPRVGNLASQGECCAHIIQEDHILPVISPLSGVIHSINPRLPEEPNLVTDDPRGDGWLITIKPENLESDLKNLLFGKKALLWHLKEEKEIIARITELMLKQSPQSLGPTMQDGGVRIKGLQDVLDMANSRQKRQILDFSVTRPRKKI